MTDSDVALPILSVSARSDPPQIAAGTPLDLTVRLMPEADTDLLGLVVEVLDADGGVIDAAEVTGLTQDRCDAGGVIIEAADGSFCTGPIRVTAPEAAGPFEVRLSVREPEEMPGDGEPHSVTLEVAAHVVGVSVWDAPRSVQAGAEFTCKVGLACADGCDSTGWTAEIRDGDGAVLASAVMGSETWKTADHLHYAEVSLTAPRIDGRYKYSVHAVPSDITDLPHAAGMSPLRFQVTPAPEFRIRVEAVDRETGKPLKGARIVADPYRALADEHGVAELFVHRGEYRLFVSGPTHIARRFDASVAQDLSFRAALARDEGFSDADLW